MAEPQGRLVGGGFLLTGPRVETPSPDAFDQTQIEFRKASRIFVEKSVAPHRKALEAHDYSRLRAVLKDFADQGFLGAEIPAEHGGLGVGIIESALIAEGIGEANDASFGVSVGAHNGIGTWPVMRFGDEAQRKRYLPKLASGELIAAYALTEPGSGSDALAAKTKAVLDGDDYVLNGEKIFITNAGVADLFTVFAKVDGKNAVFLVERSRPGISVGKEEHKMGLWASSTCPVAFQDVRVPKENLLGEIGKGHKIVMNTLNLGRFKLGAGCLGAMKYALETSVRYAADRKQFGRPILEFGDVRKKIAKMAIDVWVGEAMVYRLAGLLAASETIEEFETECAIVKVALSEMLMGAADAAVQIHGGNGYIRDYPVERLYRDARINRIFEGTNEINRLHAVGTLLKRAVSGRLDIGFQMMPGWTERDDWEKGVQTLIDAAKLSTQFALRQAGTRLGMKHVMAAAGDMKKGQERMMVEEQETLFAIADMAILTYAMDAAAWREERATGGLIATAFHFAAAGELARLHRDVYPEIFETDIQAWKKADDKVASHLECRSMGAIALRKEIAAETIAGILG